MLNTRRCYKSPRTRARAFTLVELLIVVAMVGVLATLAAVGYRRYIDSSKVSEAIHMLGAIRSAEEGFRAETMQYLDVSTSNGWYPNPASGAPSLNSKKWAWQNPAGNDYNAWMALNVATDGPVRFTYKVRAGAAGTTVTGPIAYSNPPVWPSPPTEPWYVAQAIGDPDEDGVNCNVLAHSFSNQISYEKD